MTFDEEDDDQDSLLDLLNPVGSARAAEPRQKPDFSQYGEPVAAPPRRARPQASNRRGEVLDFSAQADPIDQRPIDNPPSPRRRPASAPAIPPTAVEPPSPPVTPPPTAEPGSLTDYPVEFGKGVAEGAKNLPATALKGLAAASAGTPQAQSRAMLEKAMELVQQGMDPADAIEQVRANPPPPQKVAQDPVYRAGEAIESFGKEALSPRPGFEPGKSWTRDIGSGFGSMAAGIGTFMIPGIGPYLGSGMFAAAGVGEAGERAIKSGATEEQIGQAARFGSVAGATDLVDVLVPSLGSYGKALGFIKRVGLAAVGGALAEGGQEGLQQFIQNAIAKGIYKPDQDLFEDVPRSAAIGAIVGGVTGGGFAALPQGEQPAAAPSASSAPSAPSPAAERRILRKKGWSDEQIDTMSAAERQAELAEATEQGIEPGPEQEIATTDKKVSEKPAPLEGEVLPPERAEPSAEAEGEIIDAQPVRKALPDFSSEASPADGAGTKTSPAKVDDAADIDRAAARVAQGPSAKQIGAENFKMGHLRWPNLSRSISIETAKGGTRTDKDGKWSVPNFPAHYGRIKGTKGADGQLLDVFIGDDIKAPTAFIIDQKNPETGKFDEHKIMLGFPDQAAAQAAYDAAFSDGSGPARRQATSPISIGDLNVWMRSGRKKKPFGKPAVLALPAPDEKPTQPAETQAPDFSAEAEPAAEQPTQDRRSTDADATQPEVDEAKPDFSDQAEVVEEAEPSTEKAKVSEKEPTTDKDDRLVISTGVRLRTKSGRVTDPAPKVDARTERRTKATLNRIDAWLLSEAKKEAAGNNFVLTQLSAIQLGNVSQSERDTINLVLFGDPQGATRANVVADEEVSEAAVEENPEPEAKQQKIDDAGEKLGGARKDQWSGGIAAHDLDEMSGAERARDVVKEKVWPRPDWSEVVEGGVDPGAAYLMKLLYDRLPTSPQGRGEIDLGQQVKYVTILHAMQEAFSEVKTVEDVRGLKEKINEAVSGSPNEWSTSDFGPVLSSRGRMRYRHPAEPQYRDYNAAADAVKAGFPNIEPWQRIYRVTQFYGRKDWAIVARGKNRFIYQEGFETKEAAEAAAKTLYENRGKTKGDKGKEPSRPHLDEIRRVGPDVRQGRAIASEDFINDFGFRGVEFGNWVANDERQKTVNLAYEALHDLARILNLPPKALSLNGTLGVGFGSRGRGGKAAAHYEPAYLVINMTKIQGAGTLAHEWAHALDHYLGELDQPNAYGGAPKSISGWRDTSVKETTFAGPRLDLKLSPRLNRTAMALMQALHFKPETEELAADRIKARDEKNASGLKSWEDAAENAKDMLRQGKNPRRWGAYLRKAERQIEIWKRYNEHQARNTSKKLVPTQYLHQARALSGSGDYWVRPNEMLARAFEAYVFDKLANEGDGHVSQYLVQGVEPDRFGNGFKGNPYPVGDEREAINAAFDQFVKAMQAVEGKRGAGSRVEGRDEEPVVEDTTPVPQVTAQEKKDQIEDEMSALDEATDAMEGGEAKVNRLAVLAAKFAGYFRDGKAFGNILAARKFAKEAGFDGDAKQVEEAIELGVVQLAREIVAGSEDPQAIYTALVNLYDLQPKLGTRTSTSMRDQAFSTPVPLAYVASRLADIVGGEFILEPTAGNGALLIEAGRGRQTVFANEINETRRDNLETLGFDVFPRDATDRDNFKFSIKDARGRLQRPDRVIANPPFGAVKDGTESTVFDLSDIQDGYRTTQIDHVIALRSLAAMKERGKAVLILGGLAKTAKSEENRSDGYNSKQKREFYKALYDRYNVVDHFTVAGELYERQGAGWPVDVIVIDGRGKSSRKLPAVDVPRVYASWDQLGGLLDGLPGRGDVASDRAADRAPEDGAGGRDVGVRSGGERASEPQPETGEPGSVQPGSDERPRDEGAGRRGQEPAGDERGESERTRDQPSAERRPSGIEDFDAAFDAALDEAFGPQEGPKSSSVNFYSFRRDNPGGEWLAQKQADAMGDTRNKFTRGSPTAYLRGKNDDGAGASLPTELLAGIPGLRDEIRAAGDPQFDALLADVKRDGWKNDSPILVKVNHLGQPFIVEGNTRVAVAQAVGQKTIPVWVDWMNGAENVEGPWHPDRILPRLTKSSISSPAKRRGERPVAEVAKSAAENLTSSADDAFSGLYQLFGGGKTIGMAGAFDPETYAKAKPLFVQAAAKFAAFKGDVAELTRRMVIHMRDTLKWPREVFEEMRPYLQRFMEDLRSGAVKLGEAVVPQPAKPKAPVKQEKETDKQVAYAPKSGVQGLGTLVPVNMRSSIADSLKAISERVGDLDTYVAKELGYTKAELGDYFAAEQVDALALALDNLDRGKGFIIGDQTGIGKGRVNAAIIRWAIQKGRVPIFVTEKPNLYADMYRDLTDIGIQDFLKHDLRILPTNANLNVPLTDEGDVVLKSGEPKEHGPVLVGAAQGKFADDWDVVFTTYSQMQTVGGKDTLRRNFLDRIAPNAVLIFDESHNAGGQGKAAAARAKGKGQAENRSGFARTLVKKANGVFYSSATYAKRPDVMDLYSATDMVLAVAKVEDLADAIAKGGVPMQQVVAAMLAKGGQYIRRERSFDGVTYDTPIVPVDREQYDGMSYALAAIQNFSKLVEKAAGKLDQEIKAEAEAISGDNATGNAGADSILFTSIMHNVINQMLLALKARPVAQMAIEALKRGEKPVITVANTMESLLSNYAETAGLKPGDVFDADFSHVLTRYLDRTRTLIIKKPFSKDPVQRRYLTDDELGPLGLAAYNRAKALIAGLDLSALAASPIDRIKQDLADAGYKVGEITGRGTIIDYSGEDPILRNRPGRETSIRGRRETISKFNSGELDVIVLNQAGATGLSLHASEKFKDRRKRHMMIAQAEANIDTHMQMLGRVHRTGQVVVPTYSQLVADIPAEKRPAAVLAKKMASLNANTTASRGGALTAKDVPDFINEYGDMVAANLIQDAPELNLRLGSPVKFKESGGVEVEDSMRRITGRIPLLPLKEQESLYDHLETEYTALLEQMEAAGENALEAKTLDLKAEALESTEVVGPKAGHSSPFAAPVEIEKVRIVRQGKPFTADEILHKLANQIAPDAVDEENRIPPDQNLAAMLADIENPRGSWGALAAEQELKARRAAITEFQSYARDVLDEITDEKKAEADRVKLFAIRDRWEVLHGMLRTGVRVTLKTSDGNKTAIVVSTDRTGQAKNPLALSSWKAHFIIADGARNISIPFSRLFENGKSPEDDRTSIEVMPIGWIETPEQTLDRFVRLQAETREERFIATGNLLAAYDWLNLKGRIINYTDSEGHIRQGILTAKDFDLGKHYSTRARPMYDTAAIVQWLRSHPNQLLWSEDDVLRIEMSGRRFIITAEAAKRTGGVYYLDKDLTALTRDFYKRGSIMVADVYDPGDGLAEKIVDRLRALGAVFVDKTEARPPPAKKITKPDTGGTPSGAASDSGVASLAKVSFTPLAQQRRADLEMMLETMVRRLVGPGVRVSFEDRIPIGQVQGWGSTTAESNTAAGMYVPGQALIRLAMADPAYTGEPTDTAFHEAWHALEDRLLTDDEFAVVERETERLRDFIRRTVTYAGPVDFDNLAPFEVRAIAFQTYAWLRQRGGALGGIHIGVRRIFERLMDFFQRVRNGLAGLGFRNAEDIFASAYVGEMRGRAPRQRWAEGVPKASIRRRPAEPDDVIPAPETMRGAWDQPNLSFKERLSDVFDAMLLTPSRALWDRQIDLLRFQKAAEAMNGPQGESLDTYLAATLYPGRAGERMKDAVRDLWEPLYDAMKARGVSRDDLHLYLYARHAPERNAKIREIDPDNDAGSGMTDDEAADIMGRFLGREQDFEAIAALVDRIVEHNRDVIVREGLETEATVEAWRNAYSFYVPLKGFEAGSEDELGGSPSAGKGFDVRRGETRRALGRFDRAADTLANLLDQTQRTVIRAEKNRVAKTFLRFAQANKSPFYKIGLAERRRRISPETGMVEEYTVIAAPERDHVFAAKVGGKTYYIEIKHPGLLDALKSLGADKMPAFFKFVGRLTREYSRFQTAKNPEFVFTNLLRDLQDAGFTVNAEQRDRLFKRYLVNLGKGKALYRAVLGITERGEGTEARRWFEEWRASGGKISHYGLKDFEQIRKEIERELDRRTESRGKSVAMALPRAFNPINGNVVKFLEALSDVTETTTRLAVYISAREVGFSRAEAARLSRNATVDFNRRGRHGPYLSAMYAFANAAVQGNVRLLRTLRKSRLARKTALGIVISGMLTTLWNMAVSPDDEEKKKAYEKRPYWERERNIIIYWPGNPTAAKIPLGYGLNVFWMMGEQLAMRMLGKTGTLEALGNVIGTTVSAFNPLGSQGSFFDWGTWAKGLFPTVARPIPELALNKNWLDRPIHPNEMPWTEGTPNSQRHKALTPQWAIQAAEVMNRKTGGNKFEPGWMDLYPDDLEYAWNFTVGGLGRFLSNTHEAITNYVDGVEHPPERTPFVRRFVAADNSAVTEQESYYAKRQDTQVDARRLRNAVRARVAGTDDGSADDVIERLAPKVGARPGRQPGSVNIATETVFRQSDKALADLRRQMDLARKDTSIPRPERAKVIQGIQQQMREVMSRSRAAVSAP